MPSRRYVGPASRRGRRGAWLGRRGASGVGLSPGHPRRFGPDLAASPRRRPSPPPSFLPGPAGRVARARWGSWPLGRPATDSEGVPPRTPPPAPPEGGGAPQRSLSPSSDFGPHLATRPRPESARAVRRVSTGPSPGPDAAGAAPRSDASRRVPSPRGPSKATSGEGAGKERRREAPAGPRRHATVGRRTNPLTPSRGPGTGRASPRDRWSRPSGLSPCGRQGRSVRPPKVPARSVVLGSKGIGEPRQAASFCWKSASCGLTRAPQTRGSRVPRALHPHFLARPETVDPSGPHPRSAEVEGRDTGTSSVQQRTSEVVTGDDLRGHGVGVRD